MKKKLQKIKTKEKKYTIPLNIDERIEVCFNIKKGVVTHYSVALLLKLNGRWQDVKRCDNSHVGVAPHCHLYSYTEQGRKEAKIYLQGKPADLLTALILDFKQHHGSIISNYKLSYEKSRR
ncbi:MAG: hypothetical protein UT51_C0005G0028 [Candidatus Nomurabacteria bacterium GW2011_GWC2_39_41]|uniref:DUF7718 domain-containing protein n=2 Tax=Candidatus Nomuraibacteriota TaxID=1752729 RepID=A0A837HVG7_9BACT|nr:MAG: hypothetical protein UT27_C0005G0029 [Candidatus Nomurabacteria bacterium GW2011_GWD2_39_12]KKR20295.1 MAG: hypothetical protein UT51_C0005G0028 [Candidatus Nomurabacteria bacterium GW2011_GWC2_39_41]KKR36541.1 MAG: hypothetical protein UT70_C0010G0028 [Candidatus Nomurabacteria bacterium GW2011_GWE2_40_10]KKR38388.1 MAG: hypothetical protein UT73_C0003G0028 [Candidatus Nomurabacteria bacterium GW2011_GWB1_40_11]KKR39887.1 MAG: hypothetical protein UT74_C0005G0104 [Parcubacteria group b